MRSHSIAAVFAAVVLCAAISLMSAASRAKAETLPLQLEVKIPLGEVSGRIDHMAFDPKRQRLFVAELGNNTVSVVDLGTRKLVRRLTGLKEPQGIGYEPMSDTIYVANARDGSVNLFEGAGYVPAGAIALGADADNIRIDATGRRVIVGYGDGALALIDPVARRKVSDVRLQGHPEGFQLDPVTGRTFINMPDRRSVVVIDIAAGKEIASWPQAGRAANFPMALDHVRHQVLAVFRHPALLAILAMADGAPAATLTVCGDSDDVFVDARRQRAYVSCGEGFVDVIDLQATPATRIARIPTASGARTSLFMPDLDRLAVAVPARGSTPAGIWLFRPMP